ncbi:MAG: Phosphoenolpyruvate synthase [Candidatus Falkowbacteria bacterium GW2011_GWF2_43_32]|nr:MAG: Phosphoenolpyruvate synthase [Candidatus Falkowbacteria bacterium GW2011_GWF2_43_32]
MKDKNKPKKQSLTFIKSFSKISKKSVFEAGGKGASLGEMTAAKISVPIGF